MMSQDEKLTKIGNDVSVIKRWWPVIAGIFTVGYILIKIVSSATSTYDNEVAKKTDIEKLSKDVMALSKQVADLSNAFYKSKTEDSIDKINIKTDLKADILATNRAVYSIQRKCDAINKNVAFVMEVKKHGVNNPPDLVPVKN